MVEGVAYIGMILKETSSRYDLAHQKILVELPMPPVPGWVPEWVPEPAK